MKINVGPHARVIGPKTVSPEGAIKGLRRHAGEDVFLVQATRTPRYGPDWRHYIDEARKEARQMGRMAFHELRALRRRHLAHETAAAHQLARLAPASARPPIHKADAWVRARALDLERRLGRWLT